MSPELAAEVAEYRKPRSLRTFCTQSLKCSHQKRCPQGQACKQLKRVNWWEREYISPAAMTLQQRKAALRAAFVKGGAA